MDTRFLGDTAALLLAVVVGVALLMGFRSGAGVLAWFAIAGIIVVAYSCAMGIYRRKFS